MGIIIGRCLLSLYRAVTEWMTNRRRVPIPAAADQRPGEEPRDPDGAPRYVTARPGENAGETTY